MPLFLPLELINPLIRFALMFELAAGEELRQLFVHGLAGGEMVIAAVVTFINSNGSIAGSVFVPGPQLDQHIFCQLLGIELFFT